jgi:predicted RNA binding protein YcfA (HicA-like mRNA interferase family)
MKRDSLLRHLRLHGCYLKREGGAHSLWCNPNTGHTEAVPRHTEVADLLARKICRGLSVLTQRQSPPKLESIQKTWSRTILFASQNRR